MVCLVPEQSASSESVKAPPKCFTSWKELKDGAGVAHTYSINNSQRPLSSEARRSHHPQVAVTCATLFNGDGAFKSSSNRSGESVVVEEEGGASKSSPAASTSTRPTSTGAPLSPVSSLDWSQSAGSPAAAAALSVAGWPAHRPSRCSSLDFRTSSAVNPTQAFNRDQAPALAHHKNQAKVAQIEIDPGNALLAKRNLDDPGSPAPTDHCRPPFVTKGHLRPAAGKLKMGEDNASAAFVEKAQDQAAASSCGGASSDEIGLDSDSSSDELHYGPGFVSRLKSRYMSAALRSSSTANAGGLRRTASLEDFLDKDKEEVSIELINVHQPKVTPQQGQGQGRYQRKDERTSRRTAAGSGANNVVGVASQVNRKARESIKRCQSVEVLARNKLEDSKPPPLPPKSTTTSTSASTVESVLNSEALSNDKIQLTEKSATTSSSVPPPPPPGKTTLTEREKKKLQQPAAAASEASSTVIASLRRPFHGRRRSAGLLFGVEEKELPKTGVVDSTRKIFESRPSAGGAGLGLSSAASATGLQSRLLIKSRSTSSLYGRKSPSSSPVRRTLRQQSTDNNQQTPGSSSKKKDLNSLQSSTKPRTASPAKTSKSLVNSSSSKPALPAKPELKTTSSKNKYHNTTGPNSGAEATNVATPSKSRNKNKFEVPPLRHIDKNHRQDWNKTTPVSGKTNGSSSNNNGTAIDIEEGIKIVSKDSIDKIRQASGESFNFNFKKKQPAMATKPYLPLKQQAPAPLPPQQPPPTTQPVPPTPPPKIDTIDTSGLRDPPATPVPVGIIKPISRPVKDEPIHNKKQQQVEVQQKSRQNEAATESATAAVVPPIPPPTTNKQTTKPRAESPTTTLNNLINLTKQNNATNNTKNLNSSSNVNKLESSSTHALKKEVILIDKKPLPTKPPPPKKQDSVIQPQPLEPILKVQSSQPRPPAVFANSNKIVTFAEDIIEAEGERLDDHTSAGTLHSEVDRNGAKENNSDEGIDYMDDDMDSNMKSNYRDSWKKRQEAETKNTMVFNFLNSQKDVTHIENDGLDLSKRKKKQHLRQLAKVSAPEQHNFS